MTQTDLPRTGSAQPTFLGMPGSSDVHTGGWRTNVSIPDNALRSSKDRKSVV